MQKSLMSVPHRMVGKRYVNSSFANVDGTALQGEYRFHFTVNDSLLFIFYEYPHREVIGGTNETVLHR